jgi:cardiolipin synthase
LIRRAAADYIRNVEGDHNNATRWFTTGDEVFPAMIAAIDAAVTSVALETYIYAAGQLGAAFRAALIEACGRGVRVRVLVDGIGSMELPDYFWHPLQAAGGEVRVFNPLTLRRAGIRNHRKLLVCDGREAFIGGFNIAPEYEGDGVQRGWCDLGISLGGVLAEQLEASFERMFELADFQHKRFPRLRKTAAKRTLVGASERLLLSGPGRGGSPLLRSLRADLRHAAVERLAVRIVVPYFLPTFRLRRDLHRIARRGGRVQIILPGKADVALSQLAARSLYQRLLRAGVEIYEYEPQILHAKLFIVGEAVYVGSANLDPRSLHLNYELMVRFADSEMSGRANGIFDSLLHRSRQVQRAEWKRSRSLWTRWKERLASFILARLDPFITLRQWQRLRAKWRLHK